MSALAGKRVVVTRAAAQADGLCRLLERAGAVVLRSPTIRVSAAPDPGPLDRALERVEAYRWIVFTSSNGVRAVMARLLESGRDARALDPARVAAVGSSTAGALETHGIRPEFVPETERSRALAETLEPVAGERILLTRADIADPGMAATLRRRGASRVDDVVAYRTELVPPAGEVLEELRRGVQGITFTSPSTLRGFVAMGPEWRSLLDGVVVAALGPATTDAARRVGLEVDMEASERSMTGLVEALERAFASRTPGPDEEMAE
jgi:uroporphyrinogen III methyltransferase/synthase